jgi:hypothetical protein
VEVPDLIPNADIPRSEEDGSITNELPFLTPPTLGPLTLDVIVRYLITPSQPHRVKLFDDIPLKTIMNPDDAMADSQTAEEGASHVHLNAHQQQPGNKPAVAAWNTKKFRDEYEISKHRLLDQKFSSSKPSSSPKAGQLRWYSHL